MIAAMLLFIVLQIADVLVTLRVLDAGGRELNPVAVAVMDALGAPLGLWLLKIFVTLVVFSAVLVCGLHSFVWWLDAAYTALLGWNLYVLFRIRRSANGR